MATFQDIRNRQRQGEAARERVLQRVSNPQPVAPQRSAFDAIRNRPIETAPPPRPQPVPGYQGTPIPMQPMGSRTDFKKLGQQIKDDQAASDWLAQQQARRDAQDPSNPTLKAIKDNTIDAAAGFIDRLQVNNPVGRFFNRFGQSAGSAVGVDTQAAGAAPLVSTGNRAADVAADITGSIAGSLTNPSNAGQGLVGAPYRAGQALAQRVTSRPLAQRAIEGATAGAIQGGVISGVRGETDPGELALNVGLGAAAGAAGDVGASLLGRGVSRLFQRRGLPPELAQEVLALPPARERGNVNRATAPNVIIDADTRPVAPLGLPEPAIAPPTIARSARQVNPYRQQFEALIGRARQLETEGRLTPGREDEDLRSLWSQMAGPDAPDLDRLIDLAYPPRQSRVAPGMVQQARQYQQAREVAGAPMPVRSMQDRYRQGAIASVAPPVERLGRAPGAPRAAANRAPQDGVLNADMTPQRPRVDVTPQPVPRPAATPEQPSVLGRIGEVVADTVREAGDRITGGNASGLSPFQRSGPYDNVRSSTKSQLVTRTRRQWPANVRQWLDKVYADWVDDLNALNRFGKTTGRQLAPEDDAYRLALATRGSDVIAKHILTDQLVDSAGNAVPGGKSLADTLQQLPKGAFVDFEDYLINKHAITRHGREEKVFRDELNWTPEKGEQILAEYEARYPQFAQLADEVYQFQRNMVQRWLVDTGLVSEARAQQWFDENPFYVPNKRDFSELEKARGTSTRARRGFGNQSAPVKAYQKGGSQRKIISPIESMIENVDAYVKAAKRNQVMQAFVRNLQRDPEGLAGFAEIVKDPPKLGKAADIDLSTGDGLDEAIARFTDDFDAAMRKLNKTTDDIVRVMVDGEPVYVKVNDKQLLDSILALGPDAGNAVMDALGWLTSKMKVLTTGANPVFSLTRNIFRDIPQAYIASKTTNNPVRFMADLAQAGWELATNGELYRNFRASGGGHSSPIAADRNLLAQSKRQLLPREGGVRGVIPKAFDKLENFLNTFETAPRLAEFKRLSEHGERLRGLHEAGEVTVNFKRRGRLARQVDKVFPYFNAAVQGLDRIGRLYRDDPVKATAKAFLAITVPTMVAYAYNYRDPAYQQLSNRMKDNFLMFPLGDGTFARIAKPKEIGTLFSDLPERLMRAFHEQDPYAFEDFADQIRTTFSLPGVQGALKEGGLPQRIAGVLGDTIVGPLANVAANRDFADRPIVPGYLERLSPELQADARTSSLARRIGEATGSSPKEIDYLIRQYTGFLGQFGLSMLSPGGSLGSSLRQQVTVDPVFSNDLSTRFYDQKDRLDQARADFNVTGELPEGYNDAARRFLGRVSDDMSGIRKQMREIENDRTIPAATKREQLRALQAQINALARQATEAVNRNR